MRAIRRMLAFGRRRAIVGLYAARRREWLRDIANAMGTAVMTIDGGVIVVPARLA